MHVMRKSVVSYIDVGEMKGAVLWKGEAKIAHDLSPEIRPSGEGRPMSNTVAWGGSDVAPRIWLEAIR